MESWKSCTDNRLATTKHQGEPMGLEEVQQEIISSAEREAQRIIHEGEAAAERSKKDAEKTIDDYRLSRAEESQRLCSQLERRELAQAEFDAKKRLLDKKKELTEHAIAQARKNLANQPETARTRILKILLAKARHDLTLGSIYVNSRDRQAMKALAGKGEKIDIREKPLLGGLIAETADGTVSVDYSYEQLLAHVIERSVQELNSILFK